MRYLPGNKAEHVYAETERNVHDNHEDTLSGIIRFQSGIVGVFDINWLTPSKVRELRITGPRGMFLVDYLETNLYFLGNSEAPSGCDAMALFRGVGEGNVMKFRLKQGGPVGSRDSCLYRGGERERGAPPAVTGHDAMMALALVQLLPGLGRAGRAAPLCANRSPRAAGRR